MKYLYYSLKPAVAVDDPGRYVEKYIWDATGDVAVIKTDSGYVRAKVDDLMALLSGANATVSTVASDVSGIKSNVAVIRLVSFM